MVWNSDWPVGTVSVKANRTTGNQNTTYIETTMGNSVLGTNAVSTRDHFWDVDSTLDGRHRFIQSVGFTEALAIADPVVGTGMDGVFYFKSTNSTVQLFFRNAQGVRQISPTVLSGSKVITSSYTTLDAVPASVYGEIFMWRTTAGQFTGQDGFFKSNGTTVDAWSNYNNSTIVLTTTTIRKSLEFGNGSDASGLNIRVKTDFASSGNTWEYVIKYWAM